MSNSASPTYRGREFAHLLRSHTYLCRQKEKTAPGTVVRRILETSQSVCILCSRRATLGETHSDLPHYTRPFRHPTASEYEAGFQPIRIRSLPGYTTRCRRRQTGNRSRPLDIGSSDPAQLSLSGSSSGTLPGSMTESKVLG